MMARRSLHRPVAGAIMACLTGAACGPPPVAVVDVAPPPGGDLPPAPSAEAESAAPGEFACAWRGSALEARDSGALLCFGAERACFARASVTSGSVHLAFLEGATERTGAHLEVQVDGVRVEAWTAADQALLFPRRPLLFGGVAVPHEGRLVQIERVTLGRAVLLLTPGDRLRVLQGPLRVETSCDDLALAPASFDGTETHRALGAPSDTLGRRTLTSGLPVRIAASAGGPAVIEIALEDDESGVELVEVRAARSRILWEGGDITVAGWVDSSLVGPESGDAFGAGGLGLSGGSSGRAAGVTCPSSMPLFAEVAGARQRVGSIDAQTEFDPMDRKGEWARVGLRTDQLTLEDGATWVVRARDLERCVGE